MATEECIFFVISVIFLIGCGDSSVNNTDVSNVEESENFSEDATVPDNLNSGIEDSGQITDEIVSKACDCQESARKTDGAIDFSVMASCMCGNSSQFVNNLLGSQADDKQQINAVKVLKEKMSTKCPM